MKAPDGGERGEDSQSRVSVEVMGMYNGLMSVLAMDVGDMIWKPVKNRRWLIVPLKVLGGGAMRASGAGC